MTRSLVVVVTFMAIFARKTECQQSGALTLELVHEKMCRETDYSTKNKVFICVDNEGEFDRIHGFLDDLKISPYGENGKLFCGKTVVEINREIQDEISKTRSNALKKMSLTSAPKTKKCIESIQ